MKGFIYVIVGCVIVDVIVDLIISNGKLCLFVKSVVSLMMFYCLVMSMFDFLSQLI